ncbi:YSIRK-type signal peptide-containing protein, partial [Aerococcus vaginalis]
MFGKNNELMRKRQQREKVHQYAIKRLSVGVVSVAVSMAFLLGQQDRVSADELSPVPDVATSDLSKESNTLENGEIANISDKDISTDNNLLSLDPSEIDTVTEDTDNQYKESSTKNEKNDIAFSQIEQPILEPKTSPVSLSAPEEAIRGYAVNRAIGGNDLGTSAEGEKSHYSVQNMALTFDNVYEEDVRKGNELNFNLSFYKPGSISNKNLRFVIDENIAAHIDTITINKVNSSSQNTMNNVTYENGESSNVWETPFLRINGGIIAVSALGSFDTLGKITFDTSVENVFNLGENITPLYGYRAFLFDPTDSKIISDSETLGIFVTDDKQSPGEFTENSQYTELYKNSSAILTYDPSIGDYGALILDHHMQKNTGVPHTRDMDQTNFSVKTTPELLPYVDSVQLHWLPYSFSNGVDRTFYPNQLKMTSPLNEEGVATFEGSSYRNFADDALNINGAQNPTVVRLVIPFKKDITDIIQVMEDGNIIFKVGDNTDLLPFTSYSSLQDGTIIPGTVAFSALPTFSLERTLRYAETVVNSSENSVQIAPPTSLSGNTAPAGTVFSAGENVPDWVKVNTDGSLDLDITGQAAGDYYINVVYTTPNGDASTIAKVTITEGVTVDTSNVVAVNPIDSPQSTGIKVNNVSSDTVVKATDEDGQKITVDISDNGDVLVTPSENVDGPIEVTIDDPSLETPVTVDVLVNGHSENANDNGLVITPGDENNEQASDQTQPGENPINVQVGVNGEEKDQNPDGSWDKITPADSNTPNPSYSELTEQ